MTRLGGHEIASLVMIAASEDVGIEPVPNLAARATADLDGRRHIATCPAETPGYALSVHEGFVLVSIREVFWCRKCPISYSEKGDREVQIGRRREAFPLNVGFPTGSQIRQTIVK